MEFNSHICTTEEQSKRLLALGLKKETADMTLCYTVRMGDPDPIQYIPMPIQYKKCELDIPAWSLHRLLCLLPTEYITDIDFQQIMQDFIFRSQNIYDDAISCIETLIKDGYFYEEYLTQ